MEMLTKNILSYAAGLPEGALLTAKQLLHLGKRAAVGQALSRLVNRRKLLRVSRGIYVCLIESRFGTHAPTAAKVVLALAEQTGETVVRSGVAAANALGLTTQVPVREIYLTSGPNRRLKLGEQVIELKHAHRWQLVLPHQLGGEVIRALAWLGPRRSKTALRILKRKLPRSEMVKLVKKRSQLPAWLVKEISILVSKA